MFPQFSTTKTARTLDKQRNITAKQTGGLERQQITPAYSYHKLVPYLLSKMDQRLENHNI